MLNRLPDQDILKQGTGKVDEIAMKEGKFRGKVLEDMPVYEAR